MKFWRTTSVATLAVALSATMAFASLAPKAPAAATGGVSCQKTTLKTKALGLVMCPEMLDSSQGSFGNGFPWENSSFFFSSFRNQYLYPSSTVADTRKISCTMESLQARGVTFVGSSTNVYGGTAANPSFIKVTNAISDTLVNTFSLNTGTTSYCSVTGTDASPITISTTTGVKGTPLSTCTSCPMTDMWCQVATTEAAFNAVGNLLVDNLSIVAAAGNSGAGVWDMTTTSFGDGCAGPSRAFGSGSFVNPDNLTTAYGVDNAAFVWVFKGTAPPPPATVEQQIKEIVRLLLTPEGLRCSGLDLHPGNDKIEDDPISFPNGSKIDPIQPQISTGGTITGDELVDDLRHCGWACP